MKFIFVLLNLWFLCFDTCESLNLKIIDMIINITFQIGCDASEKLCEINATQNHEVQMCNILSLPYLDGTFDAAICIAVVHHLASKVGLRQFWAPLFHIICMDGFTDLWKLNYIIGALILPSSLLQLWFCNHLFIMLINLHSV